MNSPIRLGTRASSLARQQTALIETLLRQAWPGLEIHTQVIVTRGDQVLDTPLPLIGGKGLFTQELEAALHRAEIDYAVHSLKDLPADNPLGLIIGAVPPRARPDDVLISRADHTLKTLPLGGVVGTSSRRRAAQLLRLRPDLRLADIRGNIDTRIRKALDPLSPYDAIILAAAGLERLGQTHLISETLSLDDLLPAPGQGALAVQCRDEATSYEQLAPLNHPETESAVIAERAFLAGLGGGCSLPVAAYAQVEGDRLHLRGRITAPDGSQQIDVLLSGERACAEEIGAQLSRLALDKGASRLLERLS